MKTYQLKFLAWTFSAFLPPDDTDDSEEKVDYYQLLDVPHNANADDIKKAYRKRSLQLHPDKLKQRGMKYQGQVITEEEARSRFQEMKQAYDTLSDPKKRQIYDALGQKGTDFVNNPSHAYDPQVLMNNLANSSVFDRAKLMMLVLIFFGLVLLQPILICAKVDQMLAESGSLQDSSWVAILVPFWLFAVFYIVLLVIGKAVVPLVTWIVFVIGILFLTLKFDNTITWDYGAVFIPFYLWMVLRLYEANSDIRSIRSDMSKMVTIEYIEKYVINEVQQDEEGNDIEEGQNLHRAYNDLNEEERDEINKDYIIVHVPPKPQPPPGLETDDEEEDEFERIERSLEYQEAETRRAFASKSMQRIFLPELPLLILIIVQLDYNKSWNWGLTFLPLWIALVFECCGGCYGFFCTSALAHIEVQEQMEAHISKEMEKKEEEAKDEGEKKDDEKTKEDVEEEAKSENKEEKAGIDTAVSVEPPIKTDTPNTESETVNNNEAEEPKTEAVESPPTDLPDVSSMKISELKEELELYGVDASAFVEKSEFTAALQKARDTLPRPTATAKVESQEADKEGDTDDGDDDDAYMYEMDEDMFHHFQQAEVEAENKASEAQSKAIGSFCNIIFQAIIASVFVAKLNQVYEERDEVPPMDGTSSFSSFWIIFPFLLISGCIICCFGCAIFGASNIDTAMKSDDASESGEDNGGEEGGATAATSNDNDPVILTPPPAAVQEEVAEVPLEQKDETNGSEPESSNDVEKGETASAPTETEDMDDLD